MLIYVSRFSSRKLSIVKWWFEIIDYRFNIFFSVYITFHKFEIIWDET